MFLLAFLRPLLPQDQDLKFQRYTVLDGLTTGYVHCILQDQKGFIWIGTDKGLNRFDGYSFKTYLADKNTPTSLNNNIITDLFEDNNGRLWITCSTDEGGLHIYNRDKDNFIRVLPDPDIPLGEGQNNIRSILQDASGNIWLGTNSGILIHNPDAEEREFKPFTPQADFSSGLLKSTINVLCIDSKQNTWIGMPNGLCFMDPQKNCLLHLNYSPKDPGSLGDNRITDIVEDHYGTIWVGTRDGGLNRLVRTDTGSMDEGSFKFVRYKHDPADPHCISNNVINKLEIDESGTLWIGTDEGINRLIESQTGFFFESYHTNPLDNESLNYNFVRDIFFDRSGIMWVGTSTGLNKQKSHKFRHFKQDVSYNSLASNKVQAFLEDRNGIVWIGSSKGLNQFDRRNNSFKFIMPGATLSVSQDQQDWLWIGQWYEGLIKYNPKTREKFNYTSVNDDTTSIGADNIFTTYVDSENNVWICTWPGGLSLYNRATDNFTRYTFRSNDPNSLSSDYVSTVFEDGNGNLWVGTLNGLNLLKNKERGTFKSFHHHPADNTSISADFVTCIYETRKGTLWIGTTEGLNQMNLQDDNFTSYTRSNGLPDDGIMGILEDDHGDLWISSANGVFKIIFSKIEELDSLTESIGEISILSSSALNDPNRLVVRGYDVDDGLQSKEFVQRASLRSRNGEMFFGGINGFNVFHPDSIRDNMHPPAVVFTDFQLFNNEVSLGEVFNGDTILNKSITETDEIILSHRNNVFSIEFAALNYVAPEQNKYKYMLEGFETQWNFVDTERKATYTNLNHGEYVFKVKASNNDGIWSKEAASLHIIITPPFWKTWWFKILLIVIIIASSLAIVELRLYAIKYQKKVLEIKVKSRTQQIVEQRDQIQDQALKITQMNKLLQKHNIELEDNLQHLSEARVMQKLIGFDEFRRIYKDEYVCCKFLEELKWKDGYTCKKCGGHEYRKDEVTLMRRCTKCNYKESITTGTIFHRLRFPIDKAFYILILTSTGREINISQLSKTISLRMKTCWEFHNKVKGIMQRRKRFKNPKEGWKELIIHSQKSKAPD